MKYKALFLDLDGTTVNHMGNEPSKRVTWAVKQLKGKLQVCIATGRPFFAARQVFDHLEITGPSILTNGVQIYDPNQKKIILEKVIDRSLVPEIYRICKEYIPENHNKIHIFDGTKDVLYEEGKLEKAMSIFVTDLTNEIADSIMQRLNGFTSIAVHKGNAYNKELRCLDITHVLASKLHGIQEVSRLLGISTHEIIGVGDGYNDFPLLLACGLKFAMGNAVAELKEIADFVAPPVERDGVAMVIEKFILPQLASTTS